MAALGEACARTGWQVHALCLMPNHFHLVVETPQGNLVAGMKWWLGTYTAKEATACVIVPTVNPTHVTPHSEAFQAVIWHLFVSHPKLKITQTKWESVR